MKSCVMCSPFRFEARERGVGDEKMQEHRREPFDVRCNSIGVEIGDDDGAMGKLRELAAVATYDREHGVPSLTHGESAGDERFARASVAAADREKERGFVADGQALHVEPVREPRLEVFVV